MPQDPNLPAGCTNADIDRAFGGRDSDNDLKECPECNGNLPNCPCCDGTGEVEMTDEEQAEADQQKREAAREEAADAAADREQERRLGL